MVWRWDHRCGHNVLPLLLEDPAARVTRGSRAPVTADKGSSPLCTRSFKGVGQYQAPAGSERRATVLSQEGRKTLNKAPPNDEKRLRKAYKNKKPADHGACWWWSISPPPSGPWPWRPLRTWAPLHTTCPNDP